MDVVAVFGILLGGAWQRAVHDAVNHASYFFARAYKARDNEDRTYDADEEQFVARTDELTNESVTI